MQGRVTRKWRPPLALVLGGTLTAVLAVPLAGIAYFRVAGSVLGWGETSWMIGWLAVIATSILGYLLWRLVLRPARDLTDYARSVAKGLDAAPPTHFGTPEFSTLGQSVFDMGDSLQRRADMLRAYADHVTHELKSPLTTLRGAAELLQDDGLRQDERDTLIDQINTATERMTTLLDALRRHAMAERQIGQGTGQLAPALPRLQERFPDLEIVLDADSTLPMPQDCIQLILDQLLANAAEQGAGCVRLAATAGGITILDDGPGVSPGNRVRIFDPFFTTRRDHGGTGMGLAIVQRLVAAQGGTIRLLDQPGGAAFEIRF
ncbi:HAMP domain-containing sensor histidine kinase [Marivivens marinus]|uniref:HAMP domain-containing sensor histidine kinase n=1 Tax=Marivivens marinus TaxID=3110173 RepID=UPI003B8497BB